MRTLTWLLILAAMVLIIIILSHDRLPHALPASAPASTFSAMRAIKTIRDISQKPHPGGSIDHERVFNYITTALQSLDVPVQIQKTTAVRTWFPTYHISGRIKNILVRLPGLRNSGAILIMGHYDTVAGGPGASDDSSAIAAMLETIRALKTGCRLNNDIIFLFTDNEEVGLLGAEAFIREHPWRGDIKLVLNFDARGTNGSSLLIETGADNGRIIQEYARTAPHPTGNSLTNAAYALLPNDTDFSPFNEAGFRGFNFAFIGGVPAYHTKLDVAGAIDARSVQHHGEHMLALARHFGDLDLASLAAPNRVYFTLPPDIMISYPEWFAVLCTILAALASSIIIAWGIRKRSIAPVRLAISFAASLLMVVATGMAVAGAWLLITLIHPGYGDMIMGDPYNAAWYRAAFSAAAAAIVFIFHRVMRDKMGLPAILGGVIILYTAILIPTLILVAGASFLFLWPLVCLILSLTAELWQPRRLAVRYAILLVLCAPILFFIADLVPLLYIGLTLRLAVAAAAVTALLLLAVSPLTDIIIKTRPALFIGAALGIMGICLIGGSLTSGFDENHPRQNAAAYGLNSDTEKALWMSCDREPDRWSSQFFSVKAGHNPVPEFFPLLSMCLFKSYAPLRDEAPAISIKPPRFDLIEKTTGDETMIRGRLRSQRNAPVMRIYIEPESAIDSVTIDRKNFPHKTLADLRVGHRMAALQIHFEKRITIEYYDVPAEGIELTMKAANNAPIKLTLIDISYDLPNIPGRVIRPRPPGMIPAPDFLIRDSTMVSKTYGL